MTINLLAISACVSLLVVSVILWLREDRSWPRSGHGSTYFQSTRVHN
jgi:hypothetical protein